jgi:hypothetical protein
MARRRETKPRSSAELRGYDSQGVLAFTQNIPLLNYYEELHDVIDKADFRAKQGIRRLVGRLYNSAGHLTQEFENEYAANGALVHSRARHADGTVTER